MRPPFSRLAGGLRVGPRFFDRSGALDAAKPAPRGVVDRIDDLAHPGLDVGRIHPAVVAFFEDASGLELLVRSQWTFPFSLGWWAFRHVMRWVGQFVYPLREGRVRTWTLGLDASKDGRADVRGVVRSYVDSGEVMQVVAYATWQDGDRRYMSAAFPLPGGQVAAILRLDALCEDDEGKLAVRLTSARRGDRAGLWFVVGGRALRVPMREQIDLWPAGMAQAPAELDPDVFEGATLVGRHEQRLLGIRFATHHYWFRPCADRALPARS